MADRLVTIAQFADSAQASLAKQLLADFGIESILAGQNAANIYSGVPALGGYCKLETLESQAQQAQEILQSHRKQEH